MAAACHNCEPALTASYDKRTYKNIPARDTDLLFHMSKHFRLTATCVQSNLSAHLLHTQFISLKILRFVQTTSRQIPIDLIQMLKECTISQSLL